MADLSTTIETAAQGPHRVKGEAGEAEQQRLKDLIEADRYLQQVASARQKRGGLRFLRLLPPGAV